MNDAIAVLRAEGATVIDFDIPDQQDLNSFPGCGGLPIPPFARPSCSMASNAISTVIWRRLDLTRRYTLSATSSHTTRPTPTSR
jgi:hypothetical protein